MIPTFLSLRGLDGFIDRIGVLDSSAARAALSSLMQKLPPIEVTAAAASSRRLSRPISRAKSFGLSSGPFFIPGSGS